MTATTLLTRPDRVPEICDDATRREFLAGLAAAGLLAACGAEGTAVDEDLGAATRSVAHTSGITDVPVDPQRVIAIDYSIAVGLIALGLPPIAAPSDLEVFLAAVAEVLPSPPDVPDDATTDSGEISFEAIAARGPDVILGTDDEVDSYALLSDVAPHRARGIRHQRRLAAAIPRCGRGRRAP